MPVLRANHYGSIGATALTPARPIRVASSSASTSPDGQPHEVEIFIQLRKFDGTADAPKSDEISLARLITVRRQEHLVRNLVIGLSVLDLCNSSLCLPALKWRNDNNLPEWDIMLGLRALAVGWSGIFAGIVSWYANPLWLLALVFAFFRKVWLGSITGAIALVIALTIFTVIDRVLPADEGGVNKTKIVAKLPGAYVWFASIDLSIVAAILGARK